MSALRVRGPTRHWELTLGEVGHGEQRWDQGGRRLSFTAALFPSSGMEVVSPMASLRWMILEVRKMFGLSYVQTV